MSNRGHIRASGSAKVNFSFFDFLIAETLAMTGSIYEIKPMNTNDFVPNIGNDKRVDSKDKRMGIGKRFFGKGCFNRDDFILKQCHGKSVLHVGCTDYPFFEAALLNGDLLHAKVSEVADRVVGIDIALDDIDKMQQHGYDVKIIDAQSMANHKWNETFDIVLLADVIEHIPNPGLVLNEAFKLLAPNGKLIITVPNAFGIVRFIKSFFKYEQVHHDHVAYYSSGVLETLASHANLSIEESAWYRFEARDKRLSVYLSALFERMVTVFLPWQAEGCIAVMVPSSVAK